jgi:transposase
MTRLFWLSNEAWAAIDPHLPCGEPGKPRVDDRRAISACSSRLRLLAMFLTNSASTVRQSPRCDHLL